MLRIDSDSVVEEDVSSDQVIDLVILLYFDYGCHFFEKLMWYFSFLVLFCWLVPFLFLSRCTSWVGF